LPSFRSLVVIDAPTDLGLRPPAAGRIPGTSHAPAALRRHEQVERIGAITGGSVTPASYSPEWCPGFGTRNADSIYTFTREQAAKIGETIDSSGFPVVLGGDCSVPLVGMPAFRTRGRYGLIHIDGHCDLSHPGNGTEVEAVASEDLALVTGRGSDLLTDIDGLRPYVLVPDVDVLDSAIMPAVDSPQADGLSYAELAELVTPLLCSDRAMGLELTVFDPDLDPDGTIAAVMVDELVALFVSAGCVRA